MNPEALCPYEEVTQSEIAWFLSTLRKFRCVIGRNSRWRIDVAGPQKDEGKGSEKYFTIIAKKKRGLVPHLAPCLLRTTNTNTYVDTNAALRVSRTRTTYNVQLSSY